MINNAFWLGLPETLTKIDAAYERADGRLMLFAGLKQIFSSMNETNISIQVVNIGYLMIIEFPLKMMDRVILEI